MKNTLRLLLVIVNLLINLQASELHEAVSEKNYALAKKIIRNNQHNLHTSRKQYGQITIEIETEDYDIDELDENNQTPLHIAAKNYDFAITKLLLKSKANPNKLDGKGNVPLFYIYQKIFGQNKNPNPIKLKQWQSFIYIFIYTGANIDFIYNQKEINRKLLDIKFISQIITYALYNKKTIPINVSAIFHIFHL